MPPTGRRSILERNPWFHLARHTRPERPGFDWPATTSTPPTDPCHTPMLQPPATRKALAGGSEREANRGSRPPVHPNRDIHFLDQGACSLETARRFTGRVDRKAALAGGWGVVKQEAAPTSEGQSPTGHPNPRCLFTALKTASAWGKVSPAANMLTWPPCSTITAWLTSANRCRLSCWASNVAP